MKHYRTDCPVCGGHNFVVTPENGFSYCFNCGHKEKDSVEYKEVPQVMSKNVEEYRHAYTQAARYYHSAIDTRAREFLYQRGFTDTTIQDFQIGYCPVGMSPMYKTPIAKECGLSTYNQHAALGDRITFPYFIDKHIVTDIRGRAIDTNEEIKYKSLLGNSYYRGAIYPYNYHLHTCAKRIILTEGEIKADIAYQNGFATMAFPGIQSWKNGFQPLEDTEYILIFDNQVSHFFEVQHAIIKIARKLPQVKVATLPLMGKKKMDIDTFILQYGSLGFQLVVDGALPFESWYTLQRF